MAVRVLGGELGGRRLEVAAGVRPTESRVREALFSIWQDRIAGARFLDLFAGSGAVGLEALSRGAERVCYVERSSKALSVLRRNLKDLGAQQRVEVRRGALPAALKRRASASFDLVFADPPYVFEDHAGLLQALEGWVSASGEVVIEHSKRCPTAEIAGWQLHDQRRYGESCLSFYTSELSP